MWQLFLFLLLDRSMWVVAVLFFTCRYLGLDFSINNYYSDASKVYVSDIVNPSSPSIATLTVTLSAEDSANPTPTVYSVLVVPFSSATTKEKAHKNLRSIGGFIIYVIEI